MATDSEINMENQFINQDSTDFYEYIVIADDSLDTVNVANIPSYVPYYISIIFAIGILSGMFFGWVSSWKQ